jgi:hypothetical protein
MLTAILTAFNALLGFGKSFLGYQEKKLDTNLEAFKTAAGIDGMAYKAYLEAQVATNGQKLAANAWWGAKLIILTAGWPCSIHLAAIVLDSLPFWIPLLMDQAHVVGSWGVPKPPAPYDEYQRQIVLSFFIITPAMPLVSAVSQWLGRR